MSLVQRQDRFLYLATYFLLNLAEDVNVQRKLARRDVVRGWGTLEGDRGFFVCGLACAHSDRASGVIR